MENQDLTQEGSTASGGLVAKTIGKPQDAFFSPSKTKVKGLVGGKPIQDVLLHNSRVLLQDENFAGCCYEE